MSTSSIPAVIDALLARLHAAPELADVEIVDGQPTQNQILRPDMIVVGYSPERATTESAQERLGLSGRRDREGYDLVALVSSFSGDRAMRGTRDRCFELVDAVNGVLAADRRLGGACLYAQLSVNSWSQIQTDRGPSATAELLITITALTRK